MRSMLYPLFIFLPVISFAAEMELGVGSGHVDSGAALSSPAFVGVAVSAGQAAGMRYGASFRDATYGDTNLNEQRIGAGVSYRFPLANNFFWEPQIDVAYIQYKSSSPATSAEWRDGNATALSPSVKAGYRVGRTAIGIALRKQFADAKLNYNIPANTACLNCTGLNNVVYGPYANLDGVGRDAATEDAMKSSTWLEASVSVAF